MKVIVLSSSLNPGSKSRVMAWEALEQLKAFGAETDFIDIQDFPLPFAGADHSWNDQNAKVIIERPVVSLRCRTRIVTTPNRAIRKRKLAQRNVLRLSLGGRSGSSHRDRANRSGNKVVRWGGREFALSLGSRAV